MAVLLDFSQIAIASITVAMSKFGGQIDKEGARHIVLNMLQSYKKKFGKYGQIVICCDGKGVWRKDFFPYYKARRNENKASADNPVDWAFVYEIINELIEDLDKYFPYPVIRIAGAEGDDVIGAMCKYFSQNELIQMGLDEVPGEVLIISSDHDFKQLQYYGNVKQWSYLTKDWVRTSNPLQDLHEKIVYGDGGDGIPNAFSADDCFVTRTRQTPATEKKVTPIFEALKNTPPEQISRNVSRNNTLVNLLDKIPDDLQNAIVDRYKNANRSSKVLDYLVKHKMKNLIPYISNF